VAENICLRCSTVGLKRPLERSVVGVNTSGREGDKGITTRRVMREGNDEGVGCLEWMFRWASDLVMTRESFSSREGKRGKFVVIQVRSGTYIGQCVVEGPFVLVAVATCASVRPVARLGRRVDSSAVTCHVMCPTRWLNFVLFTSSS